VSTGGRPALEEQLHRLRNSVSDPALMIGTAKDLLEAIAKFVLEEHGMPADSRADFAHLWHLARERLGILPQQVDRNVPGFEAIRAIHQSSWTIAEQSTPCATCKGPATAARSRLG
jgi:hypothetical protein